MAATARTPASGAKFGATGHHEATEKTKATKSFSQKVFLCFVALVTS
jgi:hypothetical protein